jgi:hypothetical protein
MAFEIAFVLEPAGEGGSDLSVQIRAQPKGVFGLMTPLVARNLPRTSERITSQMVALLLDPSAGNEESPIRTQIGPMRAGLVPHAGFPVRRLMCLSSVHPVPRRDA